MRTSFVMYLLLGPMLSGGSCLREQRASKEPVTDGTKAIPPSSVLLVNSTILDVSFEVLIDTKWEAHVLGSGENQIFPRAKMLKIADEEHDVKGGNRYVIFHDNEEGVLDLRGSER